MSEVESDLERDPRMLPGPSARGLQLLLAVAFIAGPFLWLALLIFFSVSPNHLIGAHLAIIVLIAAAAVVVVVCASAFGMQRRADAREIAAGYTTLRTHARRFPVLAARTGKVVRPADPPKSIARVGSIDSGASLGPVTVPGPVTEVARTWWVVPSLALSLAVTATGIAACALSDIGGIELLGVLMLSFGIVGIVMVPAFSFSIIPAADAVRALRAQFPAAIVRVSFQSDDLRTAMLDLLGSASPVPVGGGRARARMTSYLVADADLTFWSRSGRELLPFLRIPKTAILAGRTATEIPPGRNYPLAVAKLDVAVNDGTVATITIPVGDGRNHAAWHLDVYERMVDEFLSWARPVSDPAQAGKVTSTPPPPPGSPDTTPSPSR